MSRGFTFPVVTDTLNDGTLVVKEYTVPADRQRLYLDTNIVSKVVRERDDRWELQDFVWSASDRGQVFIPHTVAEEFLLTPGWIWGIPDDFTIAYHGYDPQLRQQVVQQLITDVDVIRLGDFNFNRKESNDLSDLEIYVEACIHASTDASREEIELLELIPLFFTADKGYQRISLEDLTVREEVGEVLGHFGLSAVEIASPWDVQLTY